MAGEDPMAQRAYGQIAEYAAKIQTGAHVFIEGELIYREYEGTIETEGGPVKVIWPVTEIVIGSISLLDRKEKQERQGLRKRLLPLKQAMRPTPVYCVECLCGHHIESETNKVTYPGCQCLVVIEWPAAEEEEHQKPETIKNPTAA
jgi:single-stranded DNA-binding protein